MIPDDAYPEFERRLQNLGRELRDYIRSNYTTQTNMEYEKAQTELWESAKLLVAQEAKQYDG